MSGQEGNYYLESYFGRMGEETTIVTQFLRAVFESSVKSRTSNWVGLEMLYNTWRTKVLESGDFVDTNEYLKNSPSLRKFVANSLKPGPPDKNRADLTWEYSPKSRVTEIVRKAWWGKPEG